MGVTNIAGIPIAELTDAPNAFTLANDIAQAVDTQMIPRFTNATARDLAITAPTEGMAAYLTSASPPQLTMYSGGTWVTIVTPGLAMNNSGSGFVKQTSDLTVNNNTLSNTNLILPVAANAVYYFRIHMIYAIKSTTGSGKLGFTFPAGATLRWVLNGLDSSVSGVGQGAINMSSRASSVPQIGGQDDNTVDVAALPQGVIITAATAGNLTLQWAQNSTSAGATNAAIFRANSFMMWWRVV